MENNIPDFRNPQVAFQNALDKKVLYEKPQQYHESSDGMFQNKDVADDYYYVADWMYMHSDKSKNIDYFKNKNTRKYIEVAYV